MKTKLIKITNRFWAIVREQDRHGYHTGKEFDNTALVECDTATELSNFIADKSVEAGESMGDYSFIVVGLYTSWEQFNSTVKYEEEKNLVEAN